ncbi:MAG: HlyC/CorC family transporter [Chloroflexi bacterium]|nr:MAG: HlyC/CorC family transporter [Chloroflexota bacterium]
MSKLLLLALTIPGISFMVVVSAVAAEALPGIGTLLVPMLIIFLLVFLNGFFVAAEFAIIGVRPTQMEQMAEEGDGRARTILDILNSRRGQDQYIATAQLGITIVSLGLAMYGEPKIAHFIEPYLARWLGRDLHDALIGSMGYVIALGLLTYLHIVAGEMVPKTLALSDSVKTAMTVTPAMRALERVMSVPVHLLNQIGVLLLRLFKVPPAQGHARVLSPEELELIVTESAEDGLINVEEEEIIRNIFDFSERLVGQVMTPRPKVQAISVDMPFAEILKLVTESRHSRFPVYRNDLDHIVGIVHVKDLVRHTLRSSQAGFDIRLILRNAPAVPEDYPVALLLTAFKRQHLHMAIVLDEFGGMAGIVTLEDLVEEVVGEVRDEFDLEKEPYVELEPGVIEVAGNYLIDDLLEDVYLGERDALPDVETVGGLVVARLGRPPQVGDEVVYNETVRFRVLDVDRRAVARVRVEFPAPDRELSAELEEDEE